MTIACCVLYLAKSFGYQQEGFFVVDGGSTCDLIKIMATFLRNWVCSELHLLTVSCLIKRVH